MTHSLPDNANLGWLKKSAKQLLRQWREEGREAKLADAQFFLAREYGFPSWRSMRQTIEAGASQSSQSHPDDAVDPNVHFLQLVGRGDLDDIRQAVRKTPGLVNVVTAHPFWGGRPQPLHVAVETNRHDVFEFLLEAGADPDGSNRDYDNWSPLMLASSRRRSAMIDRLVAKGATIGLCEALLMADDEKVETLLADERLPPMIARPSGSLLALARTEMAIERLLALGVSPDGKDRWGADAMEALSRLGTRGQPLLEAMVRHGKQIKPEELARMGNHEALERRAQSSPSQVFADPVFKAAVDFKHTELVTWMLSNGANPNARSSSGSRETALHSAAWNGNLAMVRILVGAGADVSLLDEEHANTPLGWSEVSRTVTNNPDCDLVTAYLAKLE
ncbi:MAG: ankyrin repeat domain-containing protein [Alphaproteobacteria bacterium]|nr:ankyrin repeat domain-containing protein [Alphaproteobacteria bacterium]